MSYTENEGQVNYPAETADGQTVQLVEKEYDGATLVLTDSNGNKWKPDTTGTLLLPADHTDTSVSAPAPDSHATGEQIGGYEPVESGPVEPGSVDGQTFAAELPQEPETADEQTIVDVDPNGDTVIKTENGETIEVI